MSEQWSLVFVMLFSAIVIISINLVYDKGVEKGAVQYAQGKWNCLELQGTWFCKKREDK